MRWLIAAMPIVAAVVGAAVFFWLAGQKPRGTGQTSEKTPPPVSIGDEPSLPRVHLEWRQRPKRPETASSTTASLPTRFLVAPRPGPAGPSSPGERFWPLPEPEESREVNPSGFAGLPPIWSSSWGSTLRQAPRTQRQPVESPTTELERVYITPPPAVAEWRSCNWWGLAPEPQWQPWETASGRTEASSW